MSEFHVFERIRRDHKQATRTQLTPIPRRRPCDRSSGLEMPLELLLVELVDEGLIAFAQTLEADAHPSSLDLEAGTHIRRYDFPDQHDLSGWRSDLDTQFELRTDLSGPLDRHEYPSSRNIGHQETSHLPKILELNDQRGRNAWRGSPTAATGRFECSENAIEPFAKGLPALPILGRQARNSTALEAHVLAKRCE